MLSLWCVWRSIVFSPSLPDVRHINTMCGQACVLLAVHDKESIVGKPPQLLVLQLNHNA